MLIKQSDGSNLQIENKQIEELEAYAHLIKEWNHLNLVADSTLEDIWGWHILDSLSIFNWLKNNAKNKVIIDFGSGGGIPGIPLAIMGIEKVKLVERSENKLLFLSKIIKNNQYEALKFIENWPDEYILVSRGVDKIAKMLKLSNPRSEMLLYKKMDITEEIKEAEKFWEFEYSTIPRIYKASGKIVHIRNIRKK